MKKSKILIAVFAVMAAASSVSAQRLEVDFDRSGSDLGIERIKASGDEIGIAPVSKAGVSREELNHFKKGKRCVSGNCEPDYPGEHCNIHTCGSKAAEMPERAKENKEVKSLGEMLIQLDSQAQQKFYSSLRFRNGLLIEAYTKDIRAAAGEQGVKGIMRYFLPETKEKSENRAGCRPNDPDCTEDSYIDDARCFNHTCKTPYPGSTCTEAC